ncbi:MAG: hypothetical protein IBJ03_18880 [Gemmatimonadaceae bacterium]|nr:hypothetical protein [Gemmatimonadaceae bacterium]
MSAHPYGPNTSAIRQFLVQLAGLGTSDRARVVAAYEHTAATANWQRAESRLAAVIERSGREASRDALTGPLMQLVRHSTTPTALSDNASDAEVMATLDPVAEPALAALLALLVRDLLSAEDATLLLSPFDAIDVDTASA